MENLSKLLVSKKLLIFIVAVLILFSGLYFFKFVLINGNHAVKGSLNQDCPNGTIEIMKKAGLVIKNGARCELSGTARYQDSVVNIYTAEYGTVFYDDMGVPLISNILELPNGELQILSKFFLEKGKPYEYLSSVLNMPFGGWTNFTFEDFAEKQEIIKVDNNYCSSFTMKYPFKGKLIQCGENIRGDVTYASGIITWDEARKKVSLECSKYKLICTESFSGGNNPIDYWSGPAGNSVLKIINKDDKESSYYVFAGGTYQQENGNEANIIVRVHLNGKVDSQLVPRDNYDLGKLLDY